MKKHWKILAVFCIGVLIGITSTFAYRALFPKPPKGYTMSKDYVDPKSGPGHLECGALQPSCGVCTGIGGILIKHKCYFPSDSDYVITQK